MLITGCQNLKIGISLITMDWNMCRGVRRAQKIKGERSGTQDLVWPAGSKRLPGTGQLHEQFKKTQLGMGCAS